MDRLSHPLKKEPPFMTEIAVKALYGYGLKGREPRRMRGPKRPRHPALQHDHVHCKRPKAGVQQIDDKVCVVQVPPMGVVDPKRRCLLAPRYVRPVVRPRAYLARLDQAKRGQVGVREQVPRPCLIEKKLPRLSAKLEKERKPLCEKV